MTSIPATWLPSRADLDAATARTAATLADPAASRADVQRAAELEEAAHLAYLRQPGADAELQAEAELEAAAS
jgi:ABC-type transport system involved in cytochrome bd biosynthesis fused ATPase/permease subunit